MTLADRIFRRRPAVSRPCPAACADTRLALDLIARALCPTLVMDDARPLKMSDEIVRYVTARLTTPHTTEVRRLTELVEAQRRRWDALEAWLESRPFNDEAGPDGSGLHPTTYSQAVLFAMRELGG